MTADRRLINRANAERGHHAKFWSVEGRSITLCDLWAKETFASAIARAIGDGCTKSMVIRRAKVLGLPKRSPGEFSRRALLIRVPRETNEVAA